MLLDICKIEPNKISADLKSKIFWFHGEPGTWKTTVASKFPKALIAGFEIGYQFIDGVKAVPMTSWSDMKDLYRQLRNSRAKEMYDTIIFDTISNAAALCYKYALDSLDISDPSQKGFGQGWRAIKDEWKLLKDISKLGYCIVFISHSKESEIEGQNAIKVKTDLDGWAANDIWGLCDFVCYVRKELQEDGTEQVIAYSDLPNVDTKRRHPSFPAKFLFSYDNIVKGLNQIVIDTKAKGSEITNVNVREVEDESWEHVRDEVISLIESLIDTSAADEISNYITELFPNIRISQTTALDKNKLVAARDFLKNIKDTLDAK